MHCLGKGLSLQAHLGLLERAERVQQSATLGGVHMGHPSACGLLRVPIYYGLVRAFSILAFPFLQVPKTLSTQTANNRPRNAGLVVPRHRKWLVPRFRLPPSPPARLQGIPVFDARRPGFLLADAKRHLGETWRIHFFR